MAPSFITPTKTASVELPKNGLYVGIVTRVESPRVYVEVPQLTPGFSYGPCPVLANNIQIVTQLAMTSTTKGTASAITSVSGGGGTPVSTTSGTFVNAVTDNKDDFVTDVLRIVPPVGSQVLCGFLNNELDELVVLGSILS